MLLRMAGVHDRETSAAIGTLIAETYNALLVETNQGGGLYEEAASHPLGPRGFIVEACKERVEERVDMGDFATVNAFQYHLRRLAHGHLGFSDVSIRNLTQEERRDMGL